MSLKNPTPADLKYKYCQYSAGAALQVLRDKFHSGFKKFFWAGHSLDVRQALEEIDDYLLSMPCGSFGVISFLGGPPGRCRTMQGTLLTLLCDEALFHHYTRGIPLPELLGQ
ncbi:MAG: hypothetical protein ACYS7Y_28340 [Planctomycetota bacterium]|jgi:hypothetical protein